MLPKVYVETTVVSYLTAWPHPDAKVAARQQATKLWWQTARERYELFASDAVYDESSRGDTSASEARLDVLATMTLLSTTDTAKALAARLLTSKAVPSVAAEDALHIAIAAVNGLDYLLTWNIRHINNEAQRAHVERVCFDAGFKPPRICSPEFLLMETHDAD
jgi:hypothetical protein